MRIVFFVTAWACLFAHFSVENNMPHLRLIGKIRNPYHFFMFLPLLSLMGLRLEYNDTGAYIWEFYNSITLSEFFQNPDSLNMLSNPLFNFYTVVVRTLTADYHFYIMLSSLFVVLLMVSFFYKISERDTYSLTIFTYITLGTYIFSMGAMKQTIAMAILSHSVLALKDRKYLRFCLLVLVAGLIHTYAWCFYIMLLLAVRPWKLRTYAVVAATVFVLFTFRESISMLLEYGEVIGKETSEELVFSGDEMNLLRVLVYSIVPICSFIFRPVLEPQLERKHCIMIHMSIISFMFMLLASIDGANMFGRMARYFEVGIIYMFPWMVTHLFDQKSRKLVALLYIGAFALFAMYQYRSFDSSYIGITWGEFFRGLLQDRTRI